MVRRDLAYFLVLACAAGCGATDSDGDPAGDGDDAGPAIPTTDLASITPADGATRIPKTSWIRLDFDEGLDDGAARSVTLDCGEGTPAFDVDLFQGTSLIVNPKAPLPAGATCRVHWMGPNGPEEIVFTVADEGPPAVLAYDRSDTTALAPFPDDFFTEPDASTLTGLRVAIPVPSVSSSLQSLLGAAIDSAAGLDGFSPLAPIVVPLPEAIDESTIPKTFRESLDPFATLALFDVDANSPGFLDRVPFTALVRNETDKSGAPSHQLLVFSGEPLRFGGRYAFVVMNRALVSPERPLEASGFFRTAVDGADQNAAVATVNRLIGDVFGALANAEPPIRPDDAALGLSFTMRSGAEIPRDLLAIRSRVEADPPPAFEVTSVTADTDPTSDIAAIVEGTWDAPLWGDGTFLARDASGSPIQTGSSAVPFILALPKAASAGAVPITLYQHGQPGNAEDEVPRQARRSSAGMGMALIGFTDVANRNIIPDGDVVALNTAAMTTLLGSHALPDYLSVLTLADQLSFIKLISTLGTLDVLPVGSPDGRPEIDVTATLTYLGISQGATHGIGLLPYAPEIRAGALVVGGGRFSGMLIHQASEPLYQGITAFFPELTRSLYYAGIAIVQMGYDVQDPANHARYLYREPHALGPSARRPSILFVEGLGDPLNPFYAGEAAAAAMGIPHVAPAQTDVPFLDLVTAPIRANITADTTAGFFQFVPKDYPDVAATPGCVVNDEPNGHYCAQSAAEALEQREVFLQSALTGVPTIENTLQ